MKKFLNSTASVVVCLSMSIPTTARSQDQLTLDCAPKKKDREFPCLTEFGEVAGDQEAFRALRKANNKAEEEDAEEPVTADALTEEAPADSTAEAQQETEAAAEAEAQREAEAAAEAEAQREEEAAAEAEAQREAEAAAEAEAQREAEAAAEAEAQRAAEAAAEAEAHREAEAAAEAEAQQEAEAAQDAPAETTVVPDNATDETAETKEARKAARKTERKAERQEAQAAAAAATGEVAASDAEVEVTTEEVTEENTRSSDEEFATAADGTQAVAATGNQEKDGGLSNFEKALLLGLGAVVVGNVLSNGDQVVSRSGDRVVVERDGELRVLKNDDTLLRQPGSSLRTETFADGSTRNTVLREDGSQIVTIRAADGRVLSRTRITPEGEAIVIFDDTQPEQTIEVSELPVLSLTEQQSLQDEDDLTRALELALGGTAAQRFSLRQVRDISEVRKLAPEIELTNIRFETGSAAIRPEQARSLAKIGTTISEIIDADPRSVVLIEGHTDAVGGAAYNLALSDRRAETVALALTEYFGVPPENLIVQGYGESALKLPVLTAEPANRRAVVRNITPLLRQAQATQ